MLSSINLAIYGRNEKTSARRIKNSITTYSGWNKRFLLDFAKRRKLMRISFKFRENSQTKVLLLTALTVRDIESEMNDFIKRCLIYDRKLLFPFWLNISKYNQITLNTWRLIDIVMQSLAFKALNFTTDMMSPFILPSQNTHAIFYSFENYVKFKKTIVRLREFLGAMTDGLISKPPTNYWQFVAD